MSSLRYDLHIHSALSPCADDEMTPATIAGFCKLSGADVIAVCDHNSALNLPALAECCKAYELGFIPGIEVNTQEEIHLLCYFPSVERALEMSDIIYKALPDFKADRYIWGQQLIMNENDEIVGEVEKLLTNACSLDIYDATKLCRDLGGYAIPAHIEKSSYSITSVLGMVPPDLGFSVVEAHMPHKLEPMMELGTVPKDLMVLSSSDAHAIETLRTNFPILPEGCPIEKYIL